MEAYLPPIEKPKGMFLKLGYYFTRKQFGKVLMPLSVFSARMPSAFTKYYGRVPKLDKKLRLPPDTTVLIRERVASLNTCLYCMDATRWAAIKQSAKNQARFDALDDYRTSALFTATERAALEYVTELTTNKQVAPDTFAELRRHYSDREICEIVWLVASEHMYNINNIGLNIGSDELCAISPSR